MPSRVVVVIIIIIIIIIIVFETRFRSFSSLFKALFSADQKRPKATTTRVVKSANRYHFNEGRTKKERKNVLLRHRPFREASHRRRDVHQSDADVRRQIFQSQREHEFDEQHRARNFTLDYFRCVVLFLFFSLLRAFVVVRYSSSLTKNNTFSLCALNIN